MKNNYKDIPQALRASIMAPLDAKDMVNTLSEIIDLGINQNRAFTYYRGMTVYCHETKKRYEWTDNLNEKEKLMPVDFVYPRGTEFDGVNYSGLSFNFIEFKTGADDIVIEDAILKKKVVRFNKNSLGLNFTLNHNLKIDMITSMVFVFPKKIYTEKSPFIFSLVELMMFDIITSFEIVNENSFKFNNWSNYQNLTNSDYINLIIEYTEINNNVRD